MYLIQISLVKKCIQKEIFFLMNADENEIWRAICDLIKKVN